MTSKVPLQIALTVKYSFENINLDGKKTSGSGGNHTLLTIEFINGKNIPTDDAKIETLAKQLALQIKQTLKNPKQFESYKVLFDTRVTDGAETTTKFVGHEFKPGEI